MIGGLITTARFGYAAVTGVDALVDAVARYAVKLTLRSHKVDTDAGDEMVALMRSRVPVDSGRLFNGISAEADDEAVTVTASAIRGDFDYARSVEFGHHVGPRVADTAYFARATSGSEVDAEPFFLASAEEVLARRGIAMDEVIGLAAQDSGL